MKIRACAALLFSVTIISSTPARAFDGKEHTSVSETGMRLAVETCAADEKCALTFELHRQLEPFLDSNSLLQYGALVRSVDYRLNPLQLLQVAGSQQQLPRDAEALDQDLVRFLKRGGPAFFRAAATNDTHFQGELISGIRHWHAYAVQVAARRDLFAALLVNSISDHYLQDFFAPGHIVTARFGLHDAAALAIHNRYDSLGSTFVIDERAFDQQLQPLLDQLRKLNLRPDLDAVVFDHTPVPLWGDSDLWRSPQQELLMILIEARSVLDVLQSAAGGDSVNSLRDVEWTPTARRTDGHHGWHLAGGRIPYGRYAHLQEDVRAFSGGSIFGLSFGAHVLKGASTTQTRAAYQLDFIVWGQLPIEASPNGFAHFKDRSRSLRLGYVYEYNGQEIARGPAVRAVLAVPLIHSQVSGDVAWKTYLRDAEQRQALAYGVRFQAGFSILNVDLGIGRDSTFAREGLERALAMRFGVTVAGPLTSIPGIGKIEKGIFRWQRRRMEKAAALKAAIAPAVN